MSAGGTTVRVRADEGSGDGPAGGRVRSARCYDRIIGRGGASARAWLGSTLLVLAVGMLFTLVTAGAVLLEDVLDLGVWFLSAR